MSRALLITGATGKQGGATVTALLKAKADFEILAVTRDTMSPSAQRLASKSSKITLVQGNLDDCKAMFANAKKASKSPIWGVFSVQLPAMNKTGPAVEEKQGKDLVDAALANDIKCFVYASVDRGGAKSIDDPTDIPHFISKHNIEHHLIAKASGTPMSWTILRPVAFMDNFTMGFLGKVFASCWEIAVKSRPLQLIAVADIGAFAAKAFMDPAQYAGQSISLAGDELYYPQMKAIYERGTGEKVPGTWGVVARLVMIASKEMGTMFRFFEREGYGADIGALRKMHPGLLTLEDWLKSQRK